MNRNLFSLILRIVLLCVFIFGGTGAVFAAPPGPISFDGLHTWTVRPLNRTPDDATNLQKAIDQAASGDTIRLSAGVFNFGDFDSVGVAKDLTIEGAWNNELNTPLTTIMGGWSPITIGGMRPGDKPGMVKVNGHKVEHITKELAGQFYFPFLYPPYFDQEQMTWVQAYDLNQFWTPVTVNVRQLIFMRPYHIAIYFGAMNGGLVERCRFISAWPLDMDWWGGAGLGMALHWFNPQFNMGWAASVFPLPPFTNGDDANRGEVMVRSNVFEGDYKEYLDGEKDEFGHTLFAPYDGHSAPPGNDYASYVIQDSYAYTSMWLIHPDQPPTQFWVRKGYVVTFAIINGQETHIAFRGNNFGMEVTGTQMSLTVQNNYFHNQYIGISNAGPNGQFGSPENLNVTGNTFKIDLHHQIFPNCMATGVLAIDGANSPGTSAVVKNNWMDIGCTVIDGTGSAWFNSAIDLEIMGQVEVTGNTIKMYSEGAIAVWGPTQNALVQDNQISGAGDYAFASLWSNGARFINNKVSNFQPNGKGIYDLWGGGWPPFAVPAARGILYGSDNNVVQGAGNPEALDLVIDCGQNNQVTNMNVIACPAAGMTAPSSVRLSAASQSAPASLVPDKKIWPMLK